MNLPAHRPTAHAHRIVESLARESRLPVADVERIFERERHALEDVARVTHYLDIFAIRNVKEILRGRSNSAAPPGVPLNTPRSH